LGCLNKNISGKWIILRGQVKSGNHGGSRML